MRGFRKFRNLLTKGEGGVWQMMKLVDKWRRGGLANADITEKDDLKKGKKIIGFH